MTRRTSLAVQFGWVSLFQDLGSKMVVPLLPLYLALELNASALVIGTIEGLGTATAAIIAPLTAGYVARRPAMPFVRLGYGLSSVAKLLLALTTGWGQVLGIRVIDRAGKGLRDAPRDGVLASESADRHGRVFGIQQAMDKLGGVLGPLAGLAIYSLSDESFRTVFAVAFIPCAVSVGVLFLIRSHAAAPTPTTTANTWRDIPTQQWAVLVVTGIAGFAALPTGLLLLRAAEVDLSVTDAVWAFAGLRLATALTAYPAGVASDRASHRSMVAVGLGLHALSLAVAAAAGGFAGVAAAFALFGVSDALTRGPSKAWLVAQNPDTKTVALGLRSGISGAAGLASGIAAGALWSTDGTHVLVAFAAITACTAVAATRVSR